MLIDLTGLFTGSIDSVDIDCSFDLSDVQFQGGFPFRSPVHVVGEVYSHAGIVEIDADACFSYTAMCDRCCKDTVKDYEIPIFFTLVTNQSDADDDTIVVEDMKLDLKAVATEEIFLALPSVFLCKDDCKGICPTCGADLNEQACNCSQPIDPRLEALLDFMDE